MTGQSACLAAYLHQIDPFFLDLSDYVPFFRIRWYGLSYLAATLLGYLFLRWMAARGRTPLKREQAADLALAMLVGAFVGGRLGYCLLYQPRLLGFIDSFPYWGVLALQDGGMASHGGMIGSLIAAYWFARQRRLSLLHLLDMASLAAPLGFAFGRIANFINGELYGRVCPPDSPIGVQFPQEIAGWNANELEHLAPAARAVGVSADQWQTWLDAPSRFGGEINRTLDQMIQATQSGSGHADVILALQNVLPTRYPSQLIQAALEGLLVFLLLAAFWTRPRKPGVVFGSFVVLYAVARIAGERFREPDAGVGYLLFGLTEGQWLSIGMLAVGVVILIISQLRKVPKMSGWIGPKAPTAEAGR